ncbi:outer membrane protein assembly factor BamE [Roseomonas sp. E05]|uniref:outer membrane protein assembly factor BamE domain-containing protein n=1 Tax=Roseomonas sp. E05 TaxID=3046310 RepID=UPI0024B97194|nr:outer membrane protein assembly factor BamE [Roseomonas sp. E05]MDJ0388957.1 outer membrane protein assembly factor BamE [Roseomonas sp. E05]
MSLLHRLLPLAAATVLAACTPASEHAREVAAGRGAGDRLTVGTVQREIRQGMSGAEVAAVLGSPNIVTGDEHRRETWVYDRIATEQVYSSSSGGVNALFLAGASGRSGAAQTSQRSLTVIIRFDENGRVRDFSYRTSSF